MDGPRHIKGYELMKLAADRKKKRAAYAVPNKCHFKYIIEDKIAQVTNESRGLRAYSCIARCIALRVEAAVADCV